jgi:hypothetical protein
MKEVSYQEWQDLPDSIDQAKIARKKRNQEFQRYTPLPDSILQSANSEISGLKSISSTDPLYT